MAIKENDNSMVQKCLQALKDLFSANNDDESTSASFILNNAEYLTGGFPAYSTAANSSTSALYMPPAGPLPTPPAPNTTTSALYMPPAGPLPTPAAPNTTTSALYMPPAGPVPTGPLPAPNPYTTAIYMQPVSTLTMLPAPNTFTPSLYMKPVASFPTLATPNPLTSYDHPSVGVPIFIPTNAMAYPPSYHLNNNDGFVQTEVLDVLCDMQLVINGALSDSEILQDPELVKVLLIHLKKSVIKVEADIIAANQF